MFNLPFVKWAAYLPDPPIIMLNKQPFDMSTNLALDCPSADLLHKLGHDSIPYRAMLHLMTVIQDTLVNQLFYPRKRYITPSALNARN